MQHYQHCKSSFQASKFTQSVHQHVRWFLDMGKEKEAKVRRAKPTHKALNQMPPDVGFSHDIKTMVAQVSKF